MNIDISNARVARFVPIAKSFPPDYFYQFLEPLGGGILGRIVDWEGDFETIASAHNSYRKPLHHAIVYGVVLEAVPSMDLHLTGSGFTVVQTDTLAPASKHRVDRFADTLKTHFYSALSQLLHALSRQRQGLKPHAHFHWDQAPLNLLWRDAYEFCTGSLTLQDSYYDRLHELMYIERQVCRVVMGDAAYDLLRSSPAIENAYPRLVYHLRLAARNAFREEKADSVFSLDDQLKAKVVMNSICQREPNAPLSRAYRDSEAYDPGDTHTFQGKNFFA